MPLLQRHALNCLGRFEDTVVCEVEMFRLPVLLSALVCSLMLLPFTHAADHHGDPMMKKCAQVCVACQIECDSCFNHCLEMVASGKAEHKVTVQLCADCGECCKTCATLCTRNSPLAKHMLDCCVKCCDECATACEKFPNDERMVACAKSCRECQKHCAEMAKHGH